MWLCVQIDSVARHNFNFANASSKIDDVNVLHHISATRTDVDIKLALGVLLVAIVALNTQKSNIALRCGCFLIKTTSRASFADSFRMESRAGYERRRKGAPHAHQAFQCQND